MMINAFMDITQRDVRGERSTRDAVKFSSMASVE